jgi:hypothetical protein
MPVAAVLGCRSGGVPKTAVELAYLHSDTDREDEAGDDDSHPATSQICHRGGGQGAEDSAHGKD